MKCFSTSLLFVSLLISAFNTHAQINLTDKIPVNKEVKIGKLSNGLTYYIQKNKVPEKKAELRLVVNVGSVLEEDNQLGYAHFLEHMNFNGSKQFPNNQLVNYLQTIGVSFGADLNAYTSFDETVYILPIPTEKPEVIEKGFQVLEDWAGGATLTNEAIEKEKGVVLAELRLGKNANERMQSQYLPNLLNGSKYAQRLPIGKEASIKSINPTNLRNFYRDWYRPNLMAVVVVGDIDPVEVEAKIKNHFSGLKNPLNEKIRPSIIPIAARQKEEAFNVSDKEGEQTFINIYNFIKQESPIVNWADFRKELIKNIFSQMFTLRLQAVSLQPNPPFMGAAAWFNNIGVRGYETFGSTIITGKGDVKLPIEALFTEILRIKKFGFNDEELDRVKLEYFNYVENAAKEKDKTLSSELSSQLIKHYLSMKPLQSSNDELVFAKQVLPTISLSDINELYLDLDGGQKKFVLITGPEKREVPIPSNEVILSTINEVKNSNLKDYTEKRVATALIENMPIGGALVSETKDEALGIIQLKLNNGVNVYIKNTNFKNDEIVFGASRLGGTSGYALKDKFNAKYAAFAMTQMGIGELGLLELSKFLAGKNVRLTPFINESFEGYNGQSGVNDFETLLQMVYLYATKPRRDENMFNTFVNNNKTQLTQLFQNPNIQFNDTLFKVIYNGNPPNQISKIINPNEFNNLSLDAMSSIFTEKFGNADGMNFYIVGNVNIDSIKSMLINYLGGLPSQKFAHEVKDNGVRLAKGVISFDFKKGKEQKSEAMIVFSGQAHYELKEEIKLKVLNEILKIKLTEKLREDMSAVYTPSVSGNLNKYTTENYINFIDIGCTPDNIDKIISVTLDMVKDFQQKGPSGTDLSKVKEKLRLKYEEDIKTNTYWVNTYTKYMIYQIDTLQMINYLQLVNSISVDDIKMAANLYYDLNNHIVGKLMPE